mgnify:FL=1
MAMQRFAVIGLGRFGARLASNLATAGEEVIGIDRDRRIIEEMRDRVTLAVAMDATDEKALTMHGIEQVDVAVISIGENFEAAALATVLLKQLGVKRVISRAVTPTGGRILSRIGADDVVNPEDEAADRWANRLISPQFQSHFEVAPGHSIVEMKTPRAWVGKTLIDLQLRAKQQVHVVAVKRPAKSDSPAPLPAALHMPEPGRALEADDTLVLLGKDSALADLPDE